MLRNMAHMMSSQVVSWILGTVGQIAAARFLGPEGVGQLRLAFSLWMIAQIFIALGTSMYLTLEMARDRERGSALVGPILLLRMAAFVVASVLMAVYGIVAGVGPQMAAVLAIVGSTTLLLTLSDTLSAALVGLEQMAYPAIASIVSKTVYTAVMVAVLLLGGGVIGVAAATTLNAALMFGLLWYFLRRFSPISFGRPSSGYGSIVRSSTGFLAAGAIIVVYLQVDTVVIALLVDEETLGWYGTADVLASSMLFVPTIMMATLFPVIGRLHSVDTSAAADVIRRAFSALFLVGVGIGFGTIVVAEPVAVLLFGEEFRESGEVLAVLGLMMPLIFATIMVGTVAMATGRQRLWNTVMLVAIVMSIGLDLVFVPWMDRVASNGAIGGAMSYVVTEAFMLVVGIWRIAPSAFAGPSRLRIMKIVLAGAAMVAAAWPFRDTFILVPVLVGAVVFIVAVSMLGVLTEDERVMARRLAARVGIRSAGLSLDDDSELGGDERTELSKQPEGAHHEAETTEPRQQG